MAIYTVIAWRILLLTLLGRETPELPPEAFFDDFEVEILGIYAKYTNLP